ncbi:unnamed protein product, partial [Mesorhabditis belari]|uniref:SH3 domain-containing protein n=1 Tax=Mesorhabditis belari TaxID=2138241 RepID=A0AAF3EB41_9BILA
MSDFFNKHIKKTTARTKEKLLEGLGRNKATQDEAFDFHVINLQKQSKACERLFKDLKTYSTTLKELNKAEKTLRESIRELYEEEWPNRPNVCAITQSLDCQGDELERTICEDIVGSVSQYVAQFGDLKKKVEKRGRKLVDYDSARNSYNSLKESSKKAETDPKMAKATTELQQAETLYKEINGELLEILPATFDSRITFVVDNLQLLFNALATQETEAAKFHKQLVGQLDQLGQSMDSLRVARPISRVDSPPDNQLSAPTIERRSPSPSASIERNGDSTRQSIASVASDKVPSIKEMREEASEEEQVQNKVYPKLGSTPNPVATPRSEDKEKRIQQKREKDPTNPFDESDDEHHEEEKPRKVLNFVQATHKYAPQDEDELSFGPGDKIKVLETFEKDQMDDGWLMGEKDDGSKGVFPANFTKIIE